MPISRNPHGPPAAPQGAERAPISNSLASLATLAGTSTSHLATSTNSVRGSANNLGARASLSSAQQRGSTTNIRAKALSQSLNAGSVRNVSNSQGRAPPSSTRATSMSNLQSSATELSFSPAIVGSTMPARRPLRNTLIEARSEYAAEVQRRARIEWEHNRQTGKTAPAPGTVIVNLQAGSQGADALQKVAVSVAFGHTLRNNFALGQRFLRQQQRLNERAQLAELAELDQPASDAPGKTVTTDGDDEPANLGEAPPVEPLEEDEEEEEDDAASDVDEDGEDDLYVQHPDVRTMEYPPLRIQQELYSRTHPEQSVLQDGETFDALTTPPGVSLPRFYLSQASWVPPSAALHEPAQQARLAAAVQVLCLRHKVLRTVLSRNDRIVDADVVATVRMASDAGEISAETLLRVVKDAPNIALPPAAPVELTAFVRDHLARHSDLREPWTLLLLAPPNAAEAGCALVLVASRAVMDEPTASRLMVELSSVYSRVTGIPGETLPHQKAFRGDRDMMEVAFRRKRRRPGRRGDAAEYFRRIVSHLVQEEVVQGRAREKIERQIQQLAKEKVNVTAQKKYLVTRRAQYDGELARLTRQRHELEKDDPATVVRSGGSLGTFIDRTTGQPLPVTPRVREILAGAILGTAPGAAPVPPERVVERFLRKHDVDADTESKICASGISLENFAMLDDTALIHAKIPAKQRRKLLALVDFCANRLHECLQERSKIAYQLERAIAACARTLTETVEKLDTATDHLEYIEDMTARLSYVLDPPFQHMKLPVLRFDSLVGNDGIHACTGPASDYAQLYDFCPIMVPEAVVGNLRAFRHAFHVQASQLRRARLLENASGVSAAADVGQGDTTDSGVESESGAVNDDAAASAHERSTQGAAARRASVFSGDSETSKLDQLLLSTTALFRPTDAACLAAFGVLMRHITGLEEFVMGLGTSYRAREATVGPLSDTLPVAFHLRQKAFNQVLGSAIHQIRRARRHGLECPSPVLQHELQIQTDFPVRFEFVTFAEAQRWKAAGLGIDDVLALAAQDFADAPAADLPLRRLWSVDEGARFDLKLILIEQEDSIIGGFVYRRERFDAAKIERWADKYCALLRSIEHQPGKRMAVNAMIARLYQTAWTSGSKLDDDALVSGIDLAGSGAVAGQRDSFTAAVQRRRSSVADPPSAALLSSVASLQLSPTLPSNESLGSL